MTRYGGRVSQPPRHNFAGAAGQIRELLPTWTRDADGELVDWTQPPYYVAGVLDVHLPGEDQFLKPDEISKRIREYMLITWKRMHDAAKQRRHEEIMRRPYRHRGRELPGRR